ncbi:FAD-containing oxidoreductase [Streptococcus dentiloxodontae]
METYDLIVIGFGKAGKTLAANMAKLGKKVALIEKDASMYGGTCINIGCIPTKALITMAESHHTFAEAMKHKDTVVTRLRGKNEAVLEASGVKLYNAKARFVSNKVIEVSAGDETEQLTAETIVINTGTVSNVFPIPGLLDSKNVYDSTGIQGLAEQPKRLGIIGGGNIGLEFASLYAGLNSEVTVFEAAPAILGRFEESAAKLAQSYLEEDGVSFVLGAKVEKISNAKEAVIVTANGQDYTFDAVMYAMGRKPATEGLGLENTEINLTDRGAVQVDNYLETTVPGVYAAGDVAGGLQFTYTSLDDFRIIFAKLTGSSDYSLDQRLNVPNSTFIEPPLSQVGLTEKEAQAAGLPYKANELAVANMPRAHVNGDLRGLYKVIINTETSEIIGATLFGSDSHEIINLIKMAMDNHIPYTYIKNQVFTHPTMAENLNDVFNF